MPHPVLKQLQGRWLHHFPGQSIPVSNHPYCGEIPANVQHKCPLVCNLRLCPPILSLVTWEKGPTPTGYNLQSWSCKERSALSLPFFRLNIPVSFSCSSQGTRSGPLTSCSIDPVTSGVSRRPWGFRALSSCYPEPKERGSGLQDGHCAHAVAPREGVQFDGKDKRIWT